MPPYEARKRPKCRKVNQFDMAKVKRPFPIYRGDAVQKEKKEYPVTCKHCGHQFIIRV